MGSVVRSLSLGFCGKITRGRTVGTDSDLWGEDTVNSTLREGMFAFKDIRIGSDCRKNTHAFANLI